MTRDERWAALAPPKRIASELRSGGYWRDERVIDFVRETLAATPDRIAVVDEQASLAYAEAYQAARRLAEWLRSEGVGPGGVVSVQLPNWREQLIVLLACELLGAVLNPLLPLYRESELEHILSTSRSHVLIVPGSHRGATHFTETADHLRERVESLQVVLVVRPDERSVDGLTPWEEAMRCEPLSADHEAAVDGNAPALIVFTSGTEAKAKGVVHSHNTATGILRVFGEEMSLGQGTTVFMASPLSHGTGMQWGLRLTMVLRGTIVIQDRWDPAVAAELISRHTCEFSLSATPFVRDLIDHVSASDTAYDFSAFRFFMCGGAPIPREVVNEARTVLGCELLACWGQTECWSATQVRPGDDDDAKMSDGRALPGVELRVVDDDGHDVGPGEVGECLVRGPYVMLGYLNPPAGDDFSAGDWHRTGDLVTRDTRGLIRVVGRKKEIIIRGGLNISPREVEEILLEHPGVKQVAVVGYADRRLGERACAFVVPTAGSELTLEALTGFLSERQLAKYKLPERLELVDELPFSATGKVQRVTLQERLATA